MHLGLCPPNKMDFTREGTRLWGPWAEARVPCPERGEREEKVDVSREGMSEGA